MMESVLRINAEGANAETGSVVVDWPKGLWNLGMIGGALVFAPLFFSWTALILFLVVTYLSLLIGHSVGMHRMMIHRSFKARPWLEKFLVYVGVLVGMSGPFGIIRIHDLRDWAQRQAHCHDFFSHRRNYVTDIVWQLTCRFEFEQSPRLNIESHYWDSIFYQFLERTWRWHQLALALLLYALGGWPFVVWGVCARVALSVVGHWTVTYFCHNPGPGLWRVKNVGVQASNLPGLGLLTYGECWHNNHHAFPESARIGLQQGQPDPAYALIRLLEKLQLVDAVRLPREPCERDDLERIEAS